MSEEKSYSERRKERDEALTKSGYSKSYATASSLGLAFVDLTYCAKCGATVMLPVYDELPVAEHPVSLHIAHCPGRTRDEVEQDLLREK